MAFTVQTGSTANANAYISLADADIYFTDRLNTTWEDADEDVKQSAIIQATDYIDQRFRFIGQQRNLSLRTQWPRINAIDINDNVRSDVPFEVVEATAEYALIALDQALNPAPERDVTGQRISMKREKVDVIEEETRYAAGSLFALPDYPAADQKMIATGLVLAGGNMHLG